MKTKFILAAILAASVILLTRPAESYESDYERRLNDAVERNIERQRAATEAAMREPVRTREQVIITPNGPAFIEQDRNGNAFIYGPAVQPQNSLFR